jgi:hypothetical protein
MERTRFFYDGTYMDRFEQSTNTGFRGEFIAAPSQAFLGSSNYTYGRLASCPTPLSETQVRGLGPTAIAQVVPTTPTANLSIALAELYREGLPKVVGSRLWQSRAKDVREYGSEYLNVEFGLIPLWEDIKDVAKVVTKGDEIWSRYERESGKRQRRQFVFKPTQTRAAWVLSGIQAFPTEAHLLMGGAGNGTLIQQTETRSWFSGAFRYFVPPRSERFNYNVTRAQRLLGVVPNLDTVWNLTPWSWALDWAGNQGDVISNLTAFATDGLVMEWGYMMHEVKDTLTANITFPRGSVTMSREYVHRSRYPASPYSFSASPPDLTNRQRAILAALGLANLPRR